MHSLATALSQYTLDVENPNTTVRGKDLGSGKIIQVRWVWILVPGSLTVLAFVFLLCVVLETRGRQTGIWKTSLLPFLYRPVEGLNGPGTATVEQMEAAAKKETAALEYTFLGGDTEPSETAGGLRLRVTARENRQSKENYFLIYVAWEKRKQLGRVRGPLRLSLVAWRLCRAWRFPTRFNRPPPLRLNTTRVFVSHVPVAEHLGRTATRPGCESMTQGRRPPVRDTHPGDIFLCTSRRGEAIGRTQYCPGQKPNTLRTQQNNITLCLRMIPHPMYGEPGLSLFLVQNPTRSQGPSPWSYLPQRPNSPSLGLYPVSFGRSGSSSPR